MLHPAVKTVRPAQQPFRRQLARRLGLLAEQHVEDRIALPQKHSLDQMFWFEKGKMTELTFRQQNSPAGLTQWVRTLCGLTRVPANRLSLGCRQANY